MKHSLACNQTSLQAVARFLGCLMICVIQFVSGPIVFLSTINGWGMLPEQEWTWQAWEGETTSADWAQASKKMMGLLFLFCFILNGIFVILDERAAWLRICKVLAYLDDKTPNFHFRTYGFLWMGAFLDCWNVIWCSLACYVVVGASATPKDVLMDSLGMLFLYNLEKVGSDLSFVDADDWPGDRLGWIYAEMVDKQCCSSEMTGLDSSSGSAAVQDDDLVHTVHSNAFLGTCLAIYCYNCTIAALAGMVVALPIISAFTPFRLISPDLIEQG